MSPTKALSHGIDRARRAPAILLSAYAATIALTLPLAFALHERLQTHFGSSLAADLAAEGTHSQWWSEFTASSGELGQTFQPTILGFAAVLDNLSAMADGRARPSAIVWAGAASVCVWLFLNGGILDRYARGRPTRSYEFFTACGVYFVRFLRLLPFAVLIYYVIFAAVHPWLFETAYEALTRDVSVERTAFVLRLVLYLVFGLLLLSAHVLFTYAQVRAVVEDRRSMVGAVAAAARFVRRNASSVAAVHVMALLITAGVMALYAVSAPRAPQGALAMWAAVAIGQVYVAARLFVRLSLMAAAVTLFQGRLAHVGYTARPAVDRPVPPIVETIPAHQVPHIPAR